MSDNNFEKLIFGTIAFGIITLIFGGFGYGMYRHNRCSPSIIDPSFNRDRTITCDVNTVPKTLIVDSKEYIACECKQ